MPSALIIGGGPNIGRGVADKLASKGYKVAIASRSPPSDQTYKHFVFDAAKPADVPGLFAKFVAELGTPSVVIYNAAVRTVSSPTDPLDVDLASYINDMNVNVHSTFIAAREAVKNFKQLGDEPNGATFIFTGNKLNVIHLPPVLVFGIGKVGAARIMQASSQAYKGENFKFYYADQRSLDGDPVYLERDGEAHAEHYLELIQDKTQRPWLQTFVKGHGYKDFGEKYGI